jgi:7-cyano-7-deazaguanine synthase in queuosine biosynthesis
VSKEIVHPLSGGLDSLVATKILVNAGYAIRAVFLDTGQPNLQRAKRAAAGIAARYCEDLEVVKIMSDKRPHFMHRPDSLKDSGMAVMPKTGVLSVFYAAIIAEITGIRRISTGGIDGSFHRNGGIMYRLKTLFALSKFGENVEVIMPFEHKDISPEGLLALALKEGLTKEELGLSVSCNAETPCGVCMKCERRKTMGIKIN